jgi:hypothetical protein
MIDQKQTTRRSPFWRRVWRASSIGRICQMNGRYVSLPLDHRTPPAPFEPRPTAAERAWLAAFEQRLRGSKT